MLAAPDSKAISTQVSCHVFRSLMMGPRICELVRGLLTILFSLRLSLGRTPRMLGPFLRGSWSIHFYPSSDIFSHPWERCALISCVRLVKGVGGTPVAASPCTVVLTPRTVPQLHVNMSSVTVLSVILSALPLCLPSPEEMMQRLLALILKLQDKDQDDFRGSHSMH